MDVQNEIQQKDDEDFNFRWFLDKFKCGKIDWEVFFQMMKVMISKDFSKSKELNFVLLEELKQYKEMETETNILRHQIEFLEGELQIKNYSQSNLDDLEIQNSEIKTEDLNLNDNLYFEDEKFVNDVNPQDRGPVCKDVSVTLIPLSDSTLKRYLKEGINSNSNKSERKTKKTKKTITYERKRHIQKVHDGLKNHKCEQCDNKYSRSHDLKRHIERVHDGLKKYTCDKCEEAFSYPKQLNKHIKNIHGEEK